jgi:dipeptidyl aminopeptidase/acylaminoacyl peptidase
MGTMTHQRDDQEPVPTVQIGGTGTGDRGLAVRVGVALVTLAVLLVALIAALSGRGAGSGPGGAGGASLQGPSAAASAVAGPTTGATSGASGGSVAPPGAVDGSPSSPPAGAPSGRVAYSDASGALSVVDASGGAPVSLAVPGIVLGQPAWSPDGTRIAALGFGQDFTGIYVFDVSAGAGGGPARQVVAYRSADHAPFYLYWSPDSRRIAFLADEAVGISLRIANVDGSAPLDGPAHDGILRTGTPLYFQWDGATRLFLHVGAGTGAFVGEVGLDGALAGTTMPGVGDFRAAAASGDGRYLADGQGGPGAATIVVVSRDGTSRQQLAVAGPAAFAFDPAGTGLASIAAVRPAATPVGFPLGPLRLLDPRTGAARTLQDGSVIAFWWSPDGRTIATLALAPAGAPSADRTAVLAAATLASPLPSASPSPALEVHLAFVDVASGAVRGDRVVRLGDDFVQSVLPYFDQYALSHRTWSPDSTAIVLPLLDVTGQARAVVLGADGGAGRPIADATSAAWSP